MMLETVSLDSFCELLVRSKLVPPEEVRALRERWLSETGGAADGPARFRKWLVANRYLTEYQATLLARGRVDRFFLNDYKLLDRIGAGGMAGVYKAVHRLGQTVAIKVLPPSKAKDARKLARFEREGRLAMRFNHPNIVRTFQIAEDDGVHYLVMEYLEGETLEDVIRRRGMLPTVEAARVLYQALVGLEHLGQQGVVHRDLKPSNLMLVPPDTDVPCFGGTKEADTTLAATVKILDIGLGRALFEEAESSADAGGYLTADGAIFGTADYMSPEQSRDTHSVDIRSDIYSLGCTLFQALTGLPPFPDTNLVRKVVRHATEPVPSVKAFNPAVPDGLQRVIERMLAKDADQRYPTPWSAAQALQPFLTGEPFGPALPSGLPSPASSEVKQVFLEWLSESTCEEQSAATRLLPAAAPAPTVPIAVPVAQPVVDVVLVEEADRSSLWERISRRHALMVLTGAGFLLAAGVLIWAIQWLQGKKQGEEIREDEKNVGSP